MAQISTIPFFNFSSVQSKRPGLCHPNNAKLRPRQRSGRRPLAINGVLSPEVCQPGSPVQPVRLCVHRQWGYQSLNFAFSGVQLPSYSKLYILCSLLYIITFTFSNQSKEPLHKIVTMNIHRRSHQWNCNLV